MVEELGAQTSFLLWAQLSGTHPDKISVYAWVYYSVEYKMNLFENCLELEDLS